MGSSPTLCFKMLCCRAAMSTDCELLSTLGGKGLLVSYLYPFSCPFPFLCFRREATMLVLSRQEHGDIQLGWISGSGYPTGDSASCKCWVKRESFRKGQSLGCNPAICTSPSNNRYLLFSWPFFTGLALLLVCSCPQ